MEIKEITKKIANLLYKDKDVYNGVVYFDFSSYDYDEDIPSINVNDKKVLVSKFEINREGTIITIIGEHNTDRYTLDVNTCSEELFDEIYTLLNDVYSETDYSWEYGDFEDFLSKDINDNKMKRFVFEYHEVATGVVEVYAETEEEARELAQCGEGDVHIKKSQEDIGTLLNF